MPCIQCDNGMWKWGENGECRYETREECEQDNNETSRAVDFVMSQPWAIKEDALQQIITIAQRLHDRPEIIQTRQGMPIPDARGVELRDGGTAIVNLIGPIFRYANLFTDISGAASLEIFSQSFQTALDDASVNRIMLNIDSPGGMVAGISEMADIIRASDKPVTAYVEDQAASAAFWLASAADEIIISKTAELGSVGAVMRVFRNRNSDSVEFVSSQSPNKRPDIDTEAGRAAIQSRVDTLANIFIESVAEFRGVDKETVLNNFGRGGLKIGQAAINAKMADRLGSLESTIAGFTGGGTIMTDTKIDTSDITLEYISEHYPAIAQQLRDEGHEAALAEAEPELKKIGAEAERERIKAVKAQSLPGHETLIESLMFDGETTGDQAAAKILAAEREKRGQTLQQMQEDAAQPLPQPSVDGQVTTIDARSVEERAKEMWDKDEKIQAEFRAYETFLAYFKAEQAA